MSNNDNVVAWKIVITAISFFLGVVICIIIACNRPPIKRPVLTFPAPQPMLPPRDEYTGRRIIYSSLHSIPDLSGPGTLSEKITRAYNARLRQMHASSNSVSINSNDEISADDEHSSENQ